MTEGLSETEAVAGNDLLCAIGNAITCWQGIEYTVCEIYLSFFPKMLRDVPVTAFHAIRTFDARLTVTDALIKRFCNESDITQWGTLRKEIGKRAKVRNAVAHGMSSIFGTKPNRKWGIGTSPYDLNNFQGSGHQNDYYSAKELQECSEGIIALTAKLDAFRASLEENSVLQSKLFLQQTDAEKNNRIARVIAHTSKKT
ncbi:hypothetical protein [Collimonas silvisoli]|uniref:hypothetical protein n=1 Tax=Collimonas silvisoli TaxID=2825884 RepID=UPI001B8D9B7B|nr:hypothetical protein [Collimonas silvisoli]